MICNENLTFALLVLLYLIYSTSTHCIASAIIPNLLHIHTNKMKQHQNNDILQIERKNVFTLHLHHNDLEQMLISLY